MNIDSTYLSISSISPYSQIADSLNVINANYTNLFLTVSSFQQNYNFYYNPLINFYNKYYNDLNDALNTYNYNLSNWNEFYTSVASNSSKWLQPFTIFYPIVFEGMVTIDDSLTINNWLREYFPIKNSDGSLNYVEGQILLVSCYTYINENRLGVYNDIVTSNCNCSTQSGSIQLHCQTIVPDGEVVCNQGNYECKLTIDCRPIKDVDCWYTAPYLHLDGSTINTSDSVESKHNAISQIKAIINAQFYDRYENAIQTLKFSVQDCDWAFNGFQT
jgi:hypothetical protein